jgi:N-acetylglutamate synthase-like GNAT family acetyltransferase
MELSDNDLREAASHRGLKLVKSRRRKPGVGDFGMFGLTDASGKALIGIGDGGLTATPEQIAEYLRKGKVSTWAESAKNIPARREPVPSASPPPSNDDDDDDAPPVIRSRRRALPSVSASKGRQGRQETEPRETEPIGSALRPEPKLKREPEPEPELELAIRMARPADADTLRALLASLGVKDTAAAVKGAITAATERREPILVADRGGVVGCLAWHIVPTLQQGRIARVTIIAVQEDDRRSGVGGALYDAALAEFRKRKVRSVEAMSDIEVRNANAFYRALGLKQASYRFAADL